MQPSIALSREGVSTLGGDEIDDFDIALDDVEHTTSQVSNRSVERLDDSNRKQRDYNNSVPSENTAKQKRKRVKTSQLGEDADPEDNVKLQASHDISKAAEQNPRPQPAALNKSVRSFHKMNYLRTD